jgi:hypothetical protein
MITGIVHFTALEVMLTFQWEVITMIIGICAFYILSILTF